MIRIIISIEEAIVNGVFAAGHAPGASSSGTPIRASEQKLHRRFSAGVLRGPTRQERDAVGKA